MLILCFNLELSEAIKVLLVYFFFKFHLGVIKAEHVEDANEAVSGVSDGIVEGGHGLAGLGAGRAHGGRVLTGHLGLVVHRLVGVGAQRA